MPHRNYEELVLANIFMFGLLVSLTVLNLRLDDRFPFQPASSIAKETTAEHSTNQRISLPPFGVSVPAQLFIRVPFSIWFGWITLATAINVTVTLQNLTPLGPKTEFFDSPMWTTFMLLSLFIVGRVWASLTCDYV